MSPDQVKKLNHEYQFKERLLDRLIQVFSIIHFVSIWSLCICLSDKPILVLLAVLVQGEWCITIIAIFPTIAGLKVH